MTWKEMERNERDQLENPTSSAVPRPIGTATNKKRRRVGGGTRRDRFRLGWGGGVEEGVGGVKGGLRGG